ncbi:MAG: hypothetical protein ACOX3G_03205 [Armatimonadota bacterium]|jgi:hypothetical protein
MSRCLVVLSGAFLIFAILCPAVCFAQSASSNTSSISKPVIYRTSSWTSSPFGRSTYSSSLPDQSANSVYLGRFSENKYDSDSISNKYGRYGNPYGNTVTNPYSPYGNRFSSTSISNRYTTDAPKIYAEDGTYLGKLSANKYDPESISNPYGPYGSKYGNNLMNPYSTYGSKYSSQSWRNPYATNAPKIYYEKK